MKKMFEMVFGSRAVAEVIATFGLLFAVVHQHPTIQKVAETYHVTSAVMATNPASFEEAKAVGAIIITHKKNGTEGEA